METRALTVLFVGLVDHGRRMEALDLDDSIAWMALHEAMVEQVVDATGGRKVKQVQETALFVYESPTAAVHAAMALQDRIAHYHARTPPAWQMPVAAGLATGEVRIEGGDVFGSPVNAAARILARAGAGEILLSEATRLAMGSRVALEKVGPLDLKGLPEPVVVHRVVPTKGPLPYGGAQLEALKLPELSVEDAPRLAEGAGERLVDRALRTFGRIRARTVEIRVPFSGAPAARRRATWALVAALLLSGGVAGLWWALSPRVPEAAREARALAAAGEMDAAFARLGPDAQVAGDPHLSAALGALRLRDGDPAGAAEAWLRAARLDPGALTSEDIDALHELWEGATRRPLARRRAGEALALLGEEIDWVPFWRTQLKRPECAARRQAIDALGGLLEDPRAREALEREAQRPATIFCDASRRAKEALAAAQGLEEAP